MSLLSRSSRAHPTVGIDLGSTEIRAVKVAAPGLGKDGKATVVAAAARPVVDGAVSEGRILSPLALGTTLDAVLDDLGSRRGAPLAVAVSGKLTGLTQGSVNSQFTSNEWSATVRSGLGRITPTLAVADAATSVVAIGHDTELTTLTVAGAHRDLMGALDQAVRHTPAHLVNVELAASALLRAHVHTDDDTEGVLVHIGASHTLIVGRYGSHLTYVESIPEGANGIAARLAADFGIASADAAWLTRTLWATDRDLAPPGPSLFGSDIEVEDVFDTFADTGPAAASNQEEYGQAFTAAVDQFVDTIASAIETVQDDPDRFGLDDPDGVVLTGRGSLLSGLPRRFEVRLGLPTHGALPWASFKVNDRTRPFLHTDHSAAGGGLHVPSETYHRFAVAIGAAMTPLVA